MTLALTEPTSSSSPPTLKLFATGPQPTALSTLRQCYEVIVLPELDERSPATIVEYETSLMHWEQLSGNPPVGSISREVLKAFRLKLLESKYKRGGKGKRLSRSPATVNKVMRTLRAAITPLWPADRHNPSGRGLVPYCKFPSPLPRQKKLPFVFTRKQMTALYEAAEACAPPKQRRTGAIYHAACWRAAMVLALNTGPRTWDLFQLKWSDIRFDDFKHGSIFFAARKTGKLQRVPLNRAARAHLLHLRSLGFDQEKVFPGFAKGKTFYEAWRRIGRKAGVQADFEDFRKTCSTLHDDVVGGVGAWITGHEVQGVNAQNYQNPTRRVFRAVYLLKQPRAYRLGAEALLAQLMPLAG